MSKKLGYLTLDSSNNNGEIRRKLNQNGGPIPNHLTQYISTRSPVPSISYKIEN